MVPGGVQATVALAGEGRGVRAVAHARHAPELALEGARELPRDLVPSPCSMEGGKNEAKIVFHTVLGGS